MNRIELEAAIAACKAAGADPTKVEWDDLSGLLEDMLTIVPVYNVKDYGLTDDNTGDNSTAFTALLDEIPDGASIYFPGGGEGYRFTSGVTIDKNVIIYGAGYSFFPIYTLNPSPHKGGTNLLFTSPTANFLTFTTSAGNDNPIVSIRDMTIKNSASTTPTAGNGIYIEGGVGMHSIERVTIDRFYNNINCVSTNNLRVSYCNSIGAIQDSIILGNTAEPDYGNWFICHTNVFSGMNATSVARGIYIKGGGGIFIDTCHFNAQNTLTVNTQFIYQIYSEFTVLTSEIKITNCLFDNYQTNGIRLRNTTGTQIGNVLIAHNEFAPVFGSNSLHAIDTDYFGNMLITDNIGNRPINSTNYAFVKLSNGDNITLGAVQRENTGYNADYELGSGITNFRRSAQATTGLELVTMTKAQRDSLTISSGARLMIFQTDNTPGLRVWNGTNWIKYTEATD